MVLIVATCLAGCGDSKSDSDDDSGGALIPIPDSFTAYFVTGRVCMPSKIATVDSAEGTAPGYPVRFDVCTHRCITVDRSTARIQNAWQCAAGQCSMMIMASARAMRVESQSDCDGRELPNPPAGQCTDESFVFDSIEPPYDPAAAKYQTGDMAVTVPFLDLQQAQEVSTRVAAGESPQMVIQQVVGGPQPSRSWTVNFDTGHTVVSDGASLSGSDCHAMPIP